MLKTPNFKLTDDQKKFVDEHYNKLKFIDLVKQTFNNPELDGRCSEARAIKEHLGDREPIPTAYQRLPSVVLTEEQKEFIANNAKHIKSASGKPSHTEIARQLFQNRLLGPLSLEARTVSEYLKTLPEEVSGLNKSDDITDEYKAPATYKQLCEKLKEFSVLSEVDYTKLNNNQKRHFDILISFYQSPRFLQMINSYSSKVSRMIFEGEFIRTIYDKPDLTNDELNLCINLAYNYVHMITLNRHKDILDQKYEDSLSDPEAKASQALAEMIKAKSTELKECDARQQQIIKALSGSRAERNKNKVENSLTVASLIEWWKDETERKARIRREELRREEVGRELDRLESMPELKARIIGFTRSELLN
jgi:hypothetical protein